MNGNTPAWVKVAIPFILLALTGAVAFGENQSKANSALDAAGANTKKIETLAQSAARLDERTINILTEQREIKDTVKEILTEIRRR